MYAIIFVIGAFLVLVSLGGSSGAERNAKRNREEFYKHEYTDSILQGELEGFAVSMDGGFGEYDRMKISRQMREAGINDSTRYAATLIVKHCLDVMGYEYNWEWNSWHLKSRSDLDRFLNENNRPSYWDKVKDCPIDEIKKTFPKYERDYRNIDLPYNMISRWEWRDRPTNREIYNRWGFWPEGRVDYHSRYYRPKNKGEE